jgi:CBS domain containing-hemolysin-like protein
MAFDIFITFLFVFLNGFFVAAEFAIVKVRASQLEIISKNRKKS